MRAIRVFETGGPENLLLNDLDDPAPGPGELVVEVAAAGGVGLLVTQFVKAAGGKVIGTVSTEEKARLAAEAGADEVIRYDTLADDALAEEVRRRNGGEGVHVSYDGVGAATFEASLASL